jgi:hypothetical protein
VSTLIVIDGSPGVEACEFTQPNVPSSDKSAAVDRTGNRRQHACMTTQEDDARHAEPAFVEAEAD